MVLRCRVADCGWPGSLSGSSLDEAPPEEAAFLESHDAFRAGLNRLVDMPERLSDLLFRFLRQNGGKLSGPGRRREFAALTEDEVSRIEEIYLEVFGDPVD